MSRHGIDQLARIASQESRMILGLMSGTSLDGLDLALCRCRGTGFQTHVTTEAFITLPYQEDFKNSVRSVFAQKTVNLEALTLLHVQIADIHARMIEDALQSWGVDRNAVDLIASHGQTIYHAPRSLHGATNLPNATLQLGESDHIAHKTGIITCADFRQKHVAAGGEGAPLAAYGDVLLLTDEQSDRVLLNIGGISNMTVLPRTGSEDLAFSTDIGPGNTIMDALAQRDFAVAYDEDAKIARSGKVDETLLQVMLNEPFFALGNPKTTGPELFSLAWADRLSQSAAPAIQSADLMATLNRLSAEAIAQAISSLSTRDPDIFISGGGAHNALLLDHLRMLLPQCTIQTTDVLGINPDAKEAILFALLANELVAGDPELFKGRLLGSPSITMGKISLPD